MTDEYGTAIEYAVIDKDLISFNTEVGKTYLISGLTPVVIPEPPKNVTFNENDDNCVSLSWSKSQKAVKYKIYKAVDNAKSYTLIGETTSAFFNCKIENQERKSRITFAITAVSEKDRESERVLSYRTPCVVTEYGVIPAKNSSLPFAAFEKIGTEYSYIGSFDNYRDINNTIAELSNSRDNTISAVIYMLKNAEISGLNSDENTNKVIPNANMTLDMAKRTLVLYDTLFDIDTAKSNGFKFYAKNGKILTAHRSVLEVYSSEKTNTAKPVCTAIEFISFSIKETFLNFFRCACYNIL